MTDSLQLSLVLNISLLLLAATALTEFKPFRAIFHPHDNNISVQFSLALVFGVLAILSTYSSIKMQGAMVNTRVISVTAAGLIGGPIAGIGAGIIGGIHRYFVDPGSFTALGCCVGTINFGVVGALAHRRHRGLTGSRTFLVGITVVGELCQVAWLFLLSRPLSAVIALESVILLPKIFINSLGMVLLFSTINRLKQHRLDELVQSQTQALYIADRCLPYLRQGLSQNEDLGIVVDIIQRNTAGYRVTLTNRSQILASSESNRTNTIPDDFMLRCMEGDHPVVEHPSGPSWRSRQIQSADRIALPLRAANKVIGSLSLLLDEGGLHIAKVDVQFAETLAQFFSTILQLSELDLQVELRRKAELRAFQSQIDPHFFFNTLSTISALCRAQPTQARDLLLVLANYYRQVLSINESFIPLETEISNVENYLIIAQARFVDIIHISVDLPEELTNCTLPPLIIQPLVENAVRHGGTSPERCFVHIDLQRVDGYLEVAISDRGGGFPSSVIDALQDPEDKRYSGLFNVHKRLISIYGSSGGIQVTSTPQGSTVRFRIPSHPPQPKERRPFG